MSSVKKNKAQAYINQIRALESLCTTTPRKNGEDILRLLRRVETRMHRISEGHCNGALEESVLEKEHAKAYHLVKKTLGQEPAGFFINLDPRGYALKIDNSKVTLPEGLYRDWGGYGILAPDFK